MLGRANRMTTDGAHGRRVGEGFKLCSVKSNLRVLFTLSHGRTEKNHEPISDLHNIETPSDIKGCAHRPLSAEVAGSLSDTDEDSRFLRRDAI